MIGDNKLNSIPLIALCALAVPAHGAPGDAASHIAVAGPWQVRVIPGAFHVGAAHVKIVAERTFDIAPPAMIQVADEHHAQLPVWKQGGAWNSGDHLIKLNAHECTRADLLVPESVVVKTASGAGPALKLGVDYRLEPQWASVGRLEGGALAAGQPVWIDYTYSPSRIDSIVVDMAGKASLMSGAAEVISPQPPEPPAGCVTVANIWVPGRTAALTADNLYPIVEPKYPEKISTHPVAERLLPKTWAKLTSGQPVTILTWGDSVSAGGMASDPAHFYQNRFAAMLQAKFPKSAITMNTAAWGGRGSRNFVEAPSGSEHNFQEKVVDPHPDLVTMEFVNDAGMDAAAIEKNYSAFNDIFTKNGIEWIIIIPHYVARVWMKSPTDRIESDTRPFIANLREFAARHNIATADWSLRWGHLVKEGIPYETLLLNAINHPDNRGHQMLADSLLEVFGGPER